MKSRATLTTSNLKTVYNCKNGILLLLLDKIDILTLRCSGNFSLWVQNWYRRHFKDWKVDIVKLLAKALVHLYFSALTPVQLFINGRCAIAIPPSEFSIINNREFLRFLLLALIKLLLKYILMDTYIYIELISIYFGYTLPIPKSF